jgi:hypothetical protein
MYAFIVYFLAACNCQSDVELPLAIGKEIVDRALFCAIGLIVCMYSLKKPEKKISIGDISILLFIKNSIYDSTDESTMTRRPLWRPCLAFSIQHCLLHPSLLS